MVHAFQLLLLACLHGHAPAPGLTALVDDAPAEMWVLTAGARPGSDQERAAEAQDSDDDDESRLGSLSEMAPSRLAHRLAHDAPESLTRPDAVAAHAPRGPPTA